MDVPPLQGGDVHVWQWDLDAGGSVAGHEAELDVAERARLRRFRREVDARRYAAGRSGLRCILGAYTGHEPQRVPLTVGEYGKPELAGGGSLYFNLSRIPASSTMASAQPTPEPRPNTTDSPKS